MTYFKDEHPEGVQLHRLVAFTLSQIHEAQIVSNVGKHSGSVKSNQRAGTPWT